MTQEQIKAKELVDKMYENQLLSVKLENKVLAYELAKQCALIAVDEILDVLFQHHKIDFWKQVKQEILAL